MKRLFSALIIGVLIVSISCSAQPGAYGKWGMFRQGVAMQQFEILEDLPVVTAKIQQFQGGWYIKITNHNNAPIKLLVNQSSYESPSGVVSGLSRKGGTAEEAQASAEIAPDATHKEYLICQGQVAGVSGQLARLNLAFEIEGQERIMVMGVKFFSGYGK